MVDERVKALVERLHNRTQTNKITWTPTVFTHNEFETAFPKYSVRITEESTKDVEMSYLITIRNDEGITVERFSDEDLHHSFGDEAPEQGWFEFMREIYELARRQALGADKAIDAILEELE